jgi:hypothetical protein
MISHIADNLCKTVIGLPIDATHPGCFSNTLTNVICVTGLESNTMSCYYQNYSSDFVTVGVRTNTSSTHLCCTFPVSILEKGCEGSSFATPIKRKHDRVPNG